MPLVDVMRTMEPRTPLPFIRSAIARVERKQPFTLTSNTLRQPSLPSRDCSSSGIFGEMPMELTATEISSRRAQRRHRRETA